VKPFVDKWDTKTFNQWFFVRGIMQIIYKEILVCLIIFIFSDSGCITSHSSKSREYTKIDTGWVLIGHFPITDFSYQQPHFILKEYPSGGLWSGKLLRSNGEVNPIIFRLIIDEKSTVATALCEYGRSPYLGTDVLGINKQDTDQYFSFDNEYYSRNKINLSGSVKDDSILLQQDTVEELNFADHWRIKANCVKVYIPEDSLHPKVFMFGSLYEYFRAGYPILGTFIVEKKD
jgi:hypothetical protein